MAARHRRMESSENRSHAAICWPHRTGDEPLYAMTKTPNAMAGRMSRAYRIKPALSLNEILLM